MRLGNTYSSALPIHVRSYRAAVDVCDGARVGGGGVTAGTTVTATAIRITTECSPSLLRFKGTPPPFTSRVPALRAKSYSHVWNYISMIIEMFGGKEDPTPG